MIQKLNKVSNEIPPHSFNKKLCTQLQFQFNLLNSLRGSKLTSAYIKQINNIIFYTLGPSAGSGWAATARRL